MSTYAPTRRIMTAAELQEHHVGRHGRNYLLSCEGYEDVELAEGQGWKAVYAWGKDGWDLGDAPYVTFQIGKSTDKHRIQQIVEGDHDIYEFDTREDLEAALDYLFLWYAAGKRWAPLTWEDREALDKGEITVDEKFRDPWRSE